MFIIPFLYITKSQISILKILNHNLDTMTDKSKTFIKSQITEYFFKILLYAILIYLAFIQPTKSIKIGVLFPPLDSNDGKILKRIPPLLNKVHNLSTHIHQNNYELIFQEQPPYGKRIGAFNGALNLCQNHSVDVIILECWKSCVLFEFYITSLRG